MGSVKVRLNQASEEPDRTPEWRPNEESWLDRLLDFLNPYFELYWRYVGLPALIFAGAIAALVVVAKLFSS